MSLVCVEKLYFNSNKCSQRSKSKEIEVESKVESKDRMYLLNGFSNGSALGDVRQRMAGAVASQ